MGEEARGLFEDGFNSAAHVGFGLVSKDVTIIVPIFAAYQWMEGGVNKWVDMAEFGIGWLAAELFKITIITT